MSDQVQKPIYFSMASHSSGYRESSKNPTKIFNIRCNLTLHDLAFYFCSCPNLLVLQFITSLFIVSVFIVQLAIEFNIVGTQCCAFNGDIMEIIDANKPENLESFGCCRAIKKFTPVFVDHHQISVSNRCSCLSYICLFLHFL